MKKLPGLIVILGSPNDEQGNLSAMGQGRVHTGFQKYQELKNKGWKILLTGGYGEHFNTTDKPNAFYAQQLLLKWGVQAEDIVDFALSKNTVDDALQARNIVEQFDCPSMLIITSDFHLPRAEYIFRSVFSDKSLSFLGADYVSKIPQEEREALLAHEHRGLTQLKQSKMHQEDFLRHVHRS